MGGPVLRRLPAQRLLVVVLASIVAALASPVIGVTGGRSFAADAGGGSLASPVPAAGRDRPRAPGGEAFRQPLVSDGNLGLPSPMARVGAGMVGQPPLGPRGLAVRAASLGDCDGPCLVGELSSVSCASGTACTAVGTALGAAPLAEAWDRTSWRIEPIQAPTGSTGGILSGVSCTAASACLAVGSHYDSGTAVPLAESWNGSSWTIRPPPTPSGATAAYLRYVQCGPVGHLLTACMAVGFSVSSAGQLPLVEFWNGSDWAIQTAPMPPGATSGALLGVSCLSATDCTAVGEYDLAPIGYQPRTLAESWNGSSWSIQPTPNPTPSGGAALSAVWCGSPTFCTAVGSYDSPSGGFALAESWSRED